MQCLPQYNAENNVTNRLAKQLKKAKAVSVYLLDQCSSAINDSSSSAFRMRSASSAESFYGAITFATQVNVEFTKDIVKSFTDRCRSLLILRISNATLFKHLARRKWRFFTFTKRISRRTVNLSILNDYRDFCVPICRWDRVSMTLLTRDIAVQSFRTVTAWRLYGTQRWRLPNDERCAWRALVFIVFGYAGGDGERRGGGKRESGVRFQTLISRKR